MIFGSGMDFGDFYDNAPKYGLSTWDLNSIFLIMTPSYLLPFVFYYSFDGLGENMTKFVGLYMQCSDDIKGK